MKSKLIIILLVISGSFFYPFSCVGQSKDCDPIIIQDPKQTKKINELTDDLTAALDKNDALLIEQQKIEAELIDVVALKNDLIDQNAGLQIVVQNQNETINAQNGTIDTQSNNIATLNDALSSSRDSLAIALANPDIVHDTIYQEADYITVNDIKYKVSEIEQILPYQTIDTISLTTCFEDYESKIWLHAGSIDIYPHVIAFPTKQYGMTNVQFNDSLTVNMKKYQNEFKVKRIRNHQAGEMTLINLYVDPNVYLPDSLK